MKPKSIILIGIVFLIIGIFGAGYNIGTAVEKSKKDNVSVPKNTFNESEHDMQIAMVSFMDGWRACRETLGFIHDPECGWISTNPAVSIKGLSFIALNTSNAVMFYDCRHLNLPLNKGDSIYVVSPDVECGWTDDELMEMDKKSSK